MTMSGLFGGAAKSHPLRPRLLLWTLIVGIIFGALGVGDPIEQAMRSGRNLLRDHRASGKIVIVGIDDRSLRDMRAWPWPRHVFGEMAETLFKLGARRVFLDFDFSSRTEPAEDNTMLALIAPYGKRVVLAGRTYFDPTTKERTDTLPLAMFSEHSDIADINFNYLFDGSVTQLPYSYQLNGKNYQSFSAKLAGISTDTYGYFPIDFSIDPRSIPKISAIDLIQGSIARNQIAGKDVIIGTSTDQVQDMFIAPGRGRLPGVYFHVLGAETLHDRLPINTGWAILFALTALISIGCAFLQRASSVLLILSATAMGLILAPFATEPAHVFVDIVASLTMVLLQIGVIFWREARRILRDRATTNAISGLRNLNALRLEADLSDRLLIVARVHNFAEAIATLPAVAEKVLVAQIASRLTLGTQHHHLYQGDDGVFAWFADGDIASIGEHLEALHAVFRSPVMVDKSPLDLAVTFGVDIGFDRSVANRLGSALVAAGEAADDGGKWKQFDTSKLKDAAWKLSLLSQLDAAIDGGDLWVAYQPKLDLTTNTVIGAEALCRWTHPEKGNISPIEFVAAAEQHNRIEKLTLHVLDRAILAAATINGHGIPFNIAVNLSARLLEESGLVETIRRLLERHQLPATQLTLEITETAALTSDHALDILRSLRDTGLTISIDDYGTGLSTLDYLKKIPASEIKIDKSFVQAMGNSASDLLMVNSTIQLAHSLGHKVVAEGVETEEALDRLVKLNCDTAQGYFIGRPMTFQALARRLVTDGRQVA